MRRVSTFPDLLIDLKLLSVSNVASVDLQAYILMLSAGVLIQARLHMYIHIIRVERFTKDVGPTTPWMLSRSLIFPESDISGRKCRRY